MTIYGNRKPVVYNPLNKAIDQLPIIFGFNNGGTPYVQTGIILSEDGVILGAHSCSDEEYMLSDLGIVEGSRPDRHEEFKKHYPQGYRMTFITSMEDPDRARFDVAMALYASLNMED
jgi:hypothetical protein